MTVEFFQPTDRAEHLERAMPHKVTIAKNSDNIVKVRVTLEDELDVLKLYQAGISFGIHFVTKIVDDETKNH